MNQNLPQDADAGFAARAFDELRAEVSLLRRAVERLTDERTEQPDYAPTLEQIARQLADVGTWVQSISERPALQLTPRGFAAEMAAAGTGGRQHDRQLITEAVNSFAAAGARIDAMITRSRSVAAQNRELLHNRIGFAVAGMVVFAIFPGAIARSLPVSWAVPERIAARMLGTDMWHAGEAMMRKADPQRFRRVAAGGPERAKPPLQRGE
jgi:hypothetical protein